MILQRLKKFNILIERSASIFIYFFQGSELILVKAYFDSIKNICFVHGHQIILHLYTTLAIYCAEVF